MVHPSQYTLPADVCGPLRVPGVDPEGTSLGTSSLSRIGFHVSMAQVEGADLSQKEPDDGLSTGPVPAREEELDIMELLDPVEHEPTSRFHGQANTGLFDDEHEEEEEPEEVPAD